MWLVFCVLVPSVVTWNEILRISKRNNQFHKQVHQNAFLVVTETTVLYELTKTCIERKSKCITKWFNKNLAEQSTSIHLKIKCKH